MVTNYLNAQNKMGIGHVSILTLKQEKWKKGFLSFCQFASRATSCLKRIVH